MINIRPFEQRDYDVITNIRNASMPRDVTTAAHTRDWDENRPSHLKAARWVAEVEQHVVAVGEYSQSPDLYHPRKFRILVYVHPRHQNGGIGSEFYRYVSQELQPLGPIAYQARAYEDEEKTLGFLARRGFREDFRMWESLLDVPSFDPRPWDGIEQRLEHAGIRITALSEVTDDPRRDRCIFDLERETTADIPSPPSITSHNQQLTPNEIEAHFNRYLRRVLNHPERPLDAFFVALKDDEYVGLSYFELDREHRRAEILMTGVTREYRNHGIATTLKLRGIGYAREHGYTTIVTGNDSVNEAILAINDRLGFVRQPEMIFFEKSPIEFATFTPPAPIAQN